MSFQLRLSSPCGGWKLKDHFGDTLLNLVYSAFGHLVTRHIWCSWNIWSASLQINIATRTSGGDGVMIKIWKWILRPIVIAVVGGGRTKACEESPLAGSVFIFLSLAGVIWLLRDIYLALRLQVCFDMQWSKPDICPRLGFPCQLSIGLGFSLFMTALGMLLLSSVFLDGLFGWIKSLDFTQFQTLVDSLIKMQMVAGLLLMIFGAATTLWHVRRRNATKRDPRP